SAVKAWSPTGTGKSFCNRKKSRRVRTALHKRILCYVCLSFSLAEASSSLARLMAHDLIRDDMADTALPNWFTALIDDLTQSIGSDALVRDVDALRAHAGDWSEAEHHVPALLILPKTPEDVAAALACCSRRQQPVVVQGGLTGLAGGATPQPGEAALSLSRINTSNQLDTGAGTVQLQAGVVLEESRQRVKAQCW